MNISLSVDAGALGLFDAVEPPPGTTVSFENVPALGGTWPSVVVVDGDVTGAASAIRESEFVESVTVEDAGGEGICRLEWGPQESPLVGALRAVDASVTSARLAGGTWSIDVRFSSNDDASRFYGAYDGDDYPLTVDRVTATVADGGTGETAVTDAQRDALGEALDAGYFEVPRGVTTRELAERLDISDTALSQRLRRGLQAVLRDSDHVADEDVDRSREN